MGNKKSKSKDPDEGWLTIHNNNVLVSVATLPEMGQKSLPAKVKKAPVKLTLDVVVGEGLWGFIDTFGAPRSPEFEPVCSLILDSSQNGAPKPISPDVLHALFATLSPANPQCNDLITLSIQNISLESTLSDVAGVVASLPSLREVLLQRNSLRDEDIEKLITHSIANTSLKKIIISGQALSNEMRGKLESYVTEARPDLMLQV